MAPGRHPSEESLGARRRTASNGQKGAGHDREAGAASLVVEEAPQALIPAMSVNDRDIQATALLCIKQHGPSAAYFAAGRADELLEQGALAGAAMWRKILAEIERMQAVAPKGMIQ